VNDQVRSLDVFRLARQRGLYSTYVTNGYMTPEALSLLLDAGLDAMNVDVKGDNAAVQKLCKAIDVEKVWSVSAFAVRRGIHVEITTLVIPMVNDSDEALCGVARRLATELGPEVPWHVTAYSPAYRFTPPPTPVLTLERAWQIGREAGLKFVYVGNIPGHRYEHTYCAACDALLIRHAGFGVLENRLSAGRCPQCRQRIPGVWQSAR